jgi:cell division protein FtsZ
MEEEERRRREVEMQRRERLRNTQVKLTNPQNVVEMENEPAYMRRGVRLDDVQGSNEPTMSRWTITDDDEPVIKENNPYLHDKVD